MRSFADYFMAFQITLFRHSIQTNYRGLDAQSGWAAGPNSQQYLLEPSGLSVFILYLHQER